MGADVFPRLKGLEHHNGHRHPRSLASKSDIGSWPRPAGAPWLAERQKLGPTDQWISVEHSQVVGAAAVFTDRNAHNLLFTEGAFCKECAIITPYAARLFEGQTDGDQRAKCKEWAEITHL